jgi:DNA repair protein RAD16
MKNGRCEDCNHSSIQHYSHFNRTILNPIQRDGYANDGRRAMFTLKNEVLDRCLLRRTKDTRAEDMNLPPRIVQIKSIRLHPFEEDFYNAVYTQTTSSFNEYVQEGTLLNNYAHIFDLLMRMRQAVCHPYLVVHSKKDSVRGTNSSAPTVFNGTTDCHLCDESPTDRVVSTCCSTAFCKSCVIEYMETSVGIGNGNETQCPSCRSPFTIDLNQVEAIETEDSSLLVPDKMKISKIGLPSLQELPHVASGK